jgi:hypothetical protein
MILKLRLYYRHLIKLGGEVHLMVLVWAVVDGEISDPLAPEVAACSSHYTIDRPYPWVISEYPTHDGAQLVVDIPQN